jgi:hypothetical protein
MFGVQAFDLLSLLSISEVALLSPKVIAEKEQGLQ